MNDSHVLLIDQRPSIRFWLLVGGALLAALVLLAVVNYAGAERRTEEAQAAATSGRADWLTVADIARIEERCGQKYELTELATGVVRVVCTGA